VSRRKGETLGGRYRRNGYVHLIENGRLSGRLREQARSHSFDLQTIIKSRPIKNPLNPNSAGFSFQQQADQKSSNRHTS
jgi:hypothetical protein